MSPGAPAGNAFVFVVCGHRKFTDELRYSLRALRKVSRSRIFVVTDSTRNEQHIDWDDIVDVLTPDRLNDHQASIYLKTNLHKLLPAGQRQCYCYLDADIVALRPGVDDVFQQKSEPVIFAADHISFSEFSPYALHCGCLDRHSKDLRELESMLATMAARASQFAPPCEQSARAKLAKAAARIERLLKRIPYVDREFKKVSKRFAQWTHDPASQRWTSPEGHEVHTVRCNHLVERIHQKFGIQVKDAKWQHWNGGVFVFDAMSHEFLDAWHRKTMAIFTDPAWRTRDQGTLAATIWEFGLQDARVLRKEFNFVVDYFRKGRFAITTDGLHVTDLTFAAPTTPALIHVINHFGDHTWDIWDWVDRQAEMPRPPA